jgi:hypothetical protein
MEQVITDSQREDVKRLLNSPIEQLIPLLTMEQLIALLGKYFLDITDVMSLLRVGRTSVHKLEESGKLVRCRDYGIRRPRFTIDAVLACMGVQPASPKDLLEDNGRVKLYLPRQESTKDYRRR